MKKTLNGTWQFSTLENQNHKNATVPSCNYLDLMNCGDIPDPFYKTNEKDVYFVAKNDYEYKRTFEISRDEIAFEKIFLKAKMLDTICDIYVNDCLVGKSNNCYKAFSCDVKKHLICGENTIKIKFFSPVKYVEEKYKKEKCPANFNGQNGVQHIRKPSCHFGWDWGPVLPPSGITKEIFLEFVNDAKIENISITQKHNKSAVTVETVPQIQFFTEEKLTVKTEIITPKGEIIEEKNGVFEILSPELWWTYELSKKDVQPLYTVKTTVIKNGEIVDVLSKKIGLRTIELNRTKDQFGENFQFVLNGVPLFIKGANFIPPDSFVTRFTQEKLQKLIDDVLFSNMNMIRIWGGGYYGSDELFDLCDKKGILLWQDFAFACMPYPFFDNEFLDNVKGEIQYNVTRLCHHPSLAIWCGNNEIETMSPAWITQKKYVDYTEKFFYHILPDELRKIDKVTPFTPGSPIGTSHNKNVSSDNFGDTHLWAVWHGLQPMTYYRKRLTRFCSEFGFESLPDIKTIEKFADKSDYSLTSEVFESHQKCGSGNEKMVYYIASRFNIPKNFEDFIYLSQITQSECISDATEHWRRNKGRCNGSMFWQLNDCWGVCSWSSIDYYGNFKALQYNARHFNSPVCVSIENNKNTVDFYVLNDTLNKVKGKIVFDVFDFEKGVISSKSKEISVNSLENIIAETASIKKLSKDYDLKKVGLRATLIVDNKIVSSKNLLFYKEKGLNLPKVKPTFTAKVLEDKIEISVTSTKFARLTCVSSSLTTNHFSDNYFDVLPNETKVVYLPLDDNFSSEELLNSLNIMSVCDVEPKQSKMVDKFTMWRIFAKPINIGNFIYYKAL